MSVRGESGGGRAVDEVASARGGNMDGGAAYEVGSGWDHSGYTMWRHSAGDSERGGSRPYAVGGTSFGSGGGRRRRKRHGCPGASGFGGVQGRGQEIAGTSSQPDQEGCGGVWRKSGPDARLSRAHDGLSRVDRGRTFEEQRLCDGNPTNPRRRWGRSFRHLQGAAPDARNDGATTGAVGDGLGDSAKSSHIALQTCSASRDAQWFFRWRKARQRGRKGHLGLSQSASQTSSCEGNGPTRSKKGHLGTSSSAVRPCRTSRESVLRPIDESSTYPDDAGKGGQKEQEGQEASGTSQLGGLTIVRRRRRNLVVELKGRKRNRGCGAASTCNGATSSTLPGSHGAEDGQVSGDAEAGCQYSGEVHPRSTSGQKQNSRILPPWLRRGASPDDFGRNGSSQIAHTTHDGSFGTIPDRRKLAGSQSSYGIGRTAVERVGGAGSGNFEEAVRVLTSGGTNVGRSSHQPAERRRMVDQEEKQHGAACAQTQRRWQRQGRDGDDECKLGGRVRKHRFLRFSLDGGHGNLRDGTGPGAGVSEMSEWLQGTVSFLMNSDLPIGRYVRSTCLGELESSQAGSRELFACPPPFAWVEVRGDSLGRSRRARVRRKAKRAVELLTNLMVCALSHQAVGCEIAPLRGRCGVELNVSQTKMVEHLSSLASSLVRHGASSSSCGLRMPATSDRLSRLREQLGECVDLPYAKAVREFRPKNGDSAFTATQALPVIAERLSLPEQVTDFDPRPYLSEVFRQVYENPDDFLKPESEMPDSIRTKGTASREEFLKVMGRWDQLGRLFVCKASEVNPEDRCELFAVAKDQDKDRQILHRKKRNRREIHLPGASRFLPHGVLLSQLSLGDGDVCVASVDDVKDFYHAYSASESRARSSPVGPTLAVREISHLVACRDALKRKAISRHDQVVCCFKGLGMGDHAAVDIAQESHVNLLKSFGAMRDDECLSYRTPLPRPVSGFFEGVMIDDHLGIQVLPRRKTLRDTLKQAGRDQEVFAAASRAYDAAGLVAHEKKKVRRSLHATVWGGEIEGLVGFSGPFRRRLYKLAQLSIEAAKPGGVDQKISEALTGLWAFNAQFRRPMFSFIYDLYHQQSPGDSREPFTLTRGARNELCVLAMLAPLCVSDLRVPYDPYVYNVDASPSGAGVCRAKVGSRVSQEIWRRGDKLGYNAPLLSSLKSALKGSGFDEELLFSSEEETEDHEKLPPREESYSPRIQKSFEAELDRQELQRVILMAKAQKILPDRVPHSPDLVPFDFFGAVFRVRTYDSSLD